jgi:hypothetical protein
MPPRRRQTLVSSQSLSISLCFLHQPEQARRSSTGCHRFRSSPGPWSGSEGPPWSQKRQARLNHAGKEGVLRVRDFPFVSGRSSPPSWPAISTTLGLTEHSIAFPVSLWTFRAPLSSSLCPGSVARGRPSPSVARAHRRSCSGNHSEGTLSLCGSTHCPGSNQPTRMSLGAVERRHRRRLSRRRWGLATGQPLTRSTATWLVTRQ